MTLQTLAIPPAAAPAAAVPDGVTMLRAWASAASEAAQLVAPLVDTPFVPDAFRPKVDPRASAEEKAAAREVAVASATAAVLYGAGLGLDPMTSLQNIYVVGGRPGLYAAAMVALAQAHGHEVQTEDLTDTRAVVRARRRGTDHWERVTFTLDQAKKAGYTRNGKYASDPQAMLYARAASIAIRRIAQDTLKGIAAVEELQDDDARGNATAGTRTVQRAPARPALQQAALEREARASAALDGETQVVDEGRPPLPGETVVTPDGRDEPAQPIDEAQWRKINARFVDLGVRGERQAAVRLVVISAILDREIKRGSQLTAADAQLVLDTLAGTTGGRLGALLAERWPDGPWRDMPLPADEPADEHAAAELQGPPLPGEDDQAGDELDQRDAEPGDAEARPAALEGSADPWGINS